MINAPSGGPTQHVPEASAGRAPFAEAALVRRPLLDGGELLYVPHLFDGAFADFLFGRLRDEVPWEHVRIRGVPQKLATCWMGAVPYAYSGQVRHAAPRVGPVRTIAAAVESFLFASSGEAFEGVLLNYYQDGEVKLGFHADRETIIVPDTPIASVSLGAPRRFVLRLAATGETHELVLGHGSLLVMAETTQRFWKHAKTAPANARGWA